MSKFETPVHNLTLAGKLRDLDLQAVEIARDKAARRRLDDFVTTQVDPPSLEFHIQGEGMHRYDYTRLSALGAAGTLLHVRLHEQPVYKVPEDLHYAVGIASINSDDPTEWWAGWSTEIGAGYGAPKRTIYDMGTIDDDDDDDWPKNGPMTDAEWEALELERVLEQEGLRATAPQIRIGDGGWMFRPPGGKLFEPLHDLKTAQQRVNLAVGRKLGNVALPLETQANVIELRPTGSDE